jgi:hypothetical protein
MEADWFIEDIRVCGDVENFSIQAHNLSRSVSMTQEEQITKMKKAITQAIKVMGDRFGSTEADVARAIDELKTSMLTAPTAAAQPPQGAAAVTAVA